MGFWRGWGERLGFVEANTGERPLAHPQLVVKAMQIHWSRLSRASPGRSGCLRPQPLTGHHIVGQRVPQREGFGLDQTANGDKAKAVVLAVRVDPLDALAQRIDSLACLARHAFAPRLDTVGLQRASFCSPLERLRLDV